jgi:hypothetical protein
VSAHGQERDQVRRCLQAWAGYPAGRDPRPLVLLSPAVRAGPFPADGTAKLAFVRGLVEAAPGFPGEILRALRSHRQEARPPAEPLLVITATLGTSEFLTDRGERQLPAWEVHARGVPEPIWVLDPGTRRQAWRPPGLEDHEPTGDTSTARLGADGRAITLTFTGIPRPYADYPHAEVLEAGSAVAVVPVPADIGPSSFRRAYAERREVAAVLPRPLGPRVLLDGHGRPVLVLVVR